MDTVLRDVRYALRAFGRAPAFTATAVISLALGIGATSAIYSVASALLLRPLQYPAADRLVILWNRSPGLGIAEDWFSTAQYADIQTRHRGFDALAIAIGANYNLTGDGEPERVGTIRVSSNLLPLLGARASLGRLFGPEEDVPGRTGAALLSHGTWVRRYGADPGVVGRPLTLNGQPYEVDGVLAESFSLPREVMPTLGGAENAEIVLPLPLAADAARVRNREDYNILGRLAPGVTVQSAQAEMDRLTAALRAEHLDVYPPHGGLTFSIVPLQEQVVGDVRLPLLVLSGAVACVLLIACANVANLLLARALARQKEMALRSALGASRGRLVRQVITESLLLAMGGGVLGMAVSVFCVSAIRLVGARSVPRLHEISPNGQVLLFTIAVAVLSGLLFGILPALRLAKVDLQQGLKTFAGGVVSGGSGRGNWTRQSVVMAELALAVVLLIGAGLLVRSFARLQRVSPGFSATDVLTMELTLTGRKYADGPAVAEGYRRLDERFAAIPGVTATGAISALPLSQMMAWGPVSIEGRRVSGEAFVNVDQRVVAGRYFEAMQIPLLHGRLFTPQDLRTTGRVVIVDARMAADVWPGESALGKRLRTGGMDARSDAPWLTVVGVVGHIKQDGLDADSRMALYYPHAQSPTRSMTVVVRSAAAPAALVPRVKRALAGIDSDLPMYKVQTMDARVAASLAERRFSMLLLSAFAIVALALAAVGTYGVMAYAVSQSTRDLAIRMALGASPQRLLALVMGQAMRLSIAGIGLGLLGAVLLTRVLRGLLFEVKASDPLTYAGIVALLAAVTLLASAIPARRAARTNALESLKGDTR
jgi:predicted permease